MKKIILFLIVMTLITAIGFGQKSVQGTKFEFSVKQEKDAKFVLKDNYNHYLFSIINTDGMARNNQIILRKFDQANQLIKVFTMDYGPKDVSYLNNYLGSFESGSDKIIVITESYSNKFSKKEISKHIFDKKTDQFESTIIATYPIQSLSKSGTTFVSKSENNNYIAIAFVAYNAKTDPEPNQVTMLDGTSKVVWQKDVLLDPNFFTTALTVTNSGKAVLYRNAKSYKSTPAITIVTAEGKEDKPIGEDVKLQSPIAFSIGDKDYLLAFNYPAKGAKSCEFENLLLYDLENAKVLQNNKVEGVCKTKSLNDVQFKSIVIQNNEIHIFVESKAEVFVKPAVGMPISWDKNYKYENPTLIIMSYDGTLKTNKQLFPKDQYTYENFYHSFGMLNIKGTYYLNHGHLLFNHWHGTFYALDPSNNYEPNTSKHTNIDSYSGNRYVNQLVSYFPDNNRLLIAITYDDKEMQLVNILDIK